MLRFPANVKYPAYVIACMHAQRTDNTRLRAIWEGIADRAGSIAAALLVAVAVTAGITFIPSESTAYAQPAAQTLCIMLNGLIAAAGLLLCSPKK